ncbi:hypothetical protein [Pseudoduganella violaceinigra]|uniref:hypothetical protein n=1 Tax=Pseudoduganella violaceinigra TaxID=246602 RepID=UPI0012B59E6F|nr:hypothetical protein [Pseudoduganella violaceinigra]
MHLYESMYSGFCDLANEPMEIAARIHPSKRKVFDALVDGENIEIAVRNDHGELAKASIHRDITLHLNDRRGGIRDVSYASVMGGNNAKFAEVHARGFDANGEPVIRQMPDRSFRLVFCTMPPRAHVLGDAFDMDDFGARLTRLTKARITWDDRDVFHIANAGEADIRAILHFLQTYGKD